MILTETYQAVLTQNKQAMWKKIGIFLLAMWALSAILNAILPKPPPPTKEEIAQKDSLLAISEQNKREDEELSKAHYIAKSYLKKVLKDPDSFEEIEYKKYFVREEKGKKTPYAQVTIKYRAKNGFGGFNVEERGFSFNKSIKLIDVFEIK